MTRSWTWLRGQWLKSFYDFGGALCFSSTSVGRSFFCPLSASIPFLWSALFIHLIFFPSTSEKSFKNHKIWFRQIDTSETWDISKFIQIYSPHSCSSHTACPHGYSISGLSLWILWMLEPLFPTFLLLMNILRWQSLVLTDNSAEICHQKCKVAFVGGYW